MDKPVATALLDRLLGIEVALAAMEGVEQQVKADRDNTLRQLAANGYRHRRGLQVTIAALKQHLKYTS